MQLVIEIGDDWAAAVEHSAPEVRLEIGGLLGYVTNGRIIQVLPETGPAIPGAGAGATDDDGLVYTLRALSCDARSVLAEIRERGKAALITDHGRFIAAIIPFRDGEVEKQVLGAMALDLGKREDTKA